MARQSTVTGGISITAMTSLAEVRAFASEWGEFAQSADAGNPFTHPDWLLPWAERFVRSHEQIWVLAARQAGHLIGVAPFYRHAWGPGLAHSMQLWGTGRNVRFIELPQFLLDPDEPRKAARALVNSLVAESRSWDWACVSLQPQLWLQPDWLPRGGSIILLMKMVRASVVHPINEVTPPVMKRHVRESLRRGHNRLDRDYPGRWSIDSATDHADMRHALADLLALHHERSTIIGKEVHRDVLSCDADVSFLSSALSASASRGGVGIYRLLVEGRAVAALLVLRSAESSYFLLSGMSEQFWDYSPVTLLQGRAIDDAIKLGHRQVNLSTGPDRAKTRWSEQIAISPEFVLVPDRLLSLGKFSAYWLTSAAAAVKRERNRHDILLPTYGERLVKLLKRGASGDKRDQ